jgi:hypothetical protein
MREVSVCVCMLALGGMKVFGKLRVGHACVSDMR